MNFQSRRDFLKQALTSTTACLVPLPLTALAQAAHAGNVVMTPGTSLPRFIDPLPIPSKLTPLSVRKGITTYRVRMLQFSHRLHSSLPPTRLWGYEALYPGPTIEAVRGSRIDIEWENHLPDDHLFPVDQRIHGAMSPAPAVRTVPHVHGSRTPETSDGLPEDWFTPGHSARLHYPNDQRAATLWYHDHAMGITRLNVYAGLSGFYLLRDEDEHTLGLPEAAYEVPLLLQDRSVDAAGQLVYAPTNDDGLPLPPGTWGPEFFGDLPVVNGAIYPYLDVEPRVYRFRVLNGSNARFWNLHLNLAKSATDIPSLMKIRQIGSDGGFLSKPVELERLLMGPGERADVLVDFTGLEGHTVALSNDAAAPFPGWGMMAMHAPPIADLMQFRVRLPRKDGGKTFVAQNLPAVERYKEEDVLQERDLVIIERVDAQGRSLGVRINDKGYDDAVTEIVKLGTLEKWRFINTTEDAHPMHLHLVQFQILHRQGFDPVAMRAGTLKPVGALRPPPAQEAGWKDTAVVLPGEILTLLVRFEGFTGKYVYHCHMLEHEDNDMMRPFEVQA